MPLSIRPSHIDTAELLVKSYSGKVPFSHFLKTYFSKNRKHGSKDRKQISALCYGYFRLGKSLGSDFSTKEKIALGFYATQTREVDLDDLPDNYQKALVQFDTDKIFPFTESLSEEIDPRAFSQSFLNQPDLFIRIRPGRKQYVLNKLDEHHITYEQLGNECLRLDNKTLLQELFQPDKDIVIQDVNSQNIIRMFEFVNAKNDRPLKIWDCCAGSGGKSILATDYFRNVELTVSDNRKKILQSLSARFTAANIETYKAILLDLSIEAPTQLPDKSFDLIIADVPCTGSGTWSRTPEQITFFSAESIPAYASLQKAILQNALLRLSPDGYLLYITCSVFYQENEEIVDALLQHEPLSLVYKNYFKGYNTGADTLFAALLRKNDQENHPPAES